jgi:hypothetical protein
VGVRGTTGNSFGGSTDISVTVQGSGSLVLADNGGVIFSLRAGQTLILGGTGGSGPTLRGLEHDDVYKGNSRATVKIANGGTFTMNGGTITDNYSLRDGGGVFVAGSGTFTQSGRSISENVGNGHYNAASQ